MIQVSILKVHGLLSFVTPKIAQKEVFYYQDRRLKFPSVSMEIFRERDDLEAIARFY